MSHTIPITMPDGSREDIPAESVVNASTAMLEAMRRPPALHRIQMIPVRIDLDRDASAIKGGQVYIKHPARMRIAAAAGCRMVGHPRSWRETDEDGRVRTVCEVSMNRPGFVDEPVTQIADGIEADQPANIREHFTAKLVTRATSRCLKSLLGESFLYDPSYIRERGGLFVFASIQPDMDDPDVRQVMLDRMRGASVALFGSQPQAPAMPQSDPVDLASIPADIDDHPETAAGEPEGDGAAPASFTDAPAAAPAWWRSFARDKASSAINWESLPPASAEKAVRAGIREVDYPHGDDPAGVVKAAKDADWITAAKRLYEFGGGSDA